MTYASAHPVALRVQDVDFSYGQLQVLFGISLQVYEGEALALLGTNGAGKSTLLRVIAGLEKASGGAVDYFGADITGVPAERLAAQRLLLVVGGRGVFTDMTVDENLKMQALTAKMAKSHLKERRQVVYDTFPSLAIRRRQKAGTLSGGEQQQLAVAKALLLDPKVLCIDELSLGLAPLVVERLLKLIAQINREGTTVLLVEQDVQVALEHADRGYVLETGRVVQTSAAVALLEDPRIRQAYLGL